MNALASSQSGSETLTITTLRLSDGTVSTPYSQQLKANIEGATWRVSNGVLPAGLQLSYTGYLSGTPTSAGTNTIEITANNGTDTASSYFMLVVNPAGALTVTSNSEIRAQVGQEVNFRFTANMSSVKWTSDGMIPLGLILNPDSGALSGTPRVSGTFMFNVTATGNAQSANRYVTMIIAMPGESPDVGSNIGGDSGGGGGCDSGFGVIGLIIVGAALGFKHSR